MICRVLLLTTAAANGSWPWPVNRSKIVANSMRSTVTAIVKCGRWWSFEITAELHVTKTRPDTNCNAHLKISNGVSVKLKIKRRVEHYIALIWISERCAVHISIHFPLFHCNTNIVYCKPDRFDLCLSWDVAPLLPSFVLRYEDAINHILAPYIRVVINIEYLLITAYTLF